MTGTELAANVLYGATLTVGVIMAVQTAASWRYLALGQKFFLFGIACFQGFVAHQINHDQVQGWSVLVVVLGDASFLCYLLEPKSLTKKRRGKDVLVHKKDQR